MKLATLVLTILGSCAVASAQELFVCGTSAQTNANAQRLATWARARADAGGGAAATTRVAEDFVLVRADGQTAPFDDPVDLEGITLHFTRHDAATYTLTKLPLAYDADTGPLFESFGRGVSTREYALTSFTFPFGEAARNRITLSVARGIHFESEPAIPNRTFDATELLLTPKAIIAPLLDYFGSPAPRPDVHLKEADGALTITWKPQSVGAVDFDIQAVLFANGDIRFNYRKVRGLAWGGVALNTGNTAWIANRSVIGTASDLVDDVDSRFTAGRPMIDITGIELARVAGTSLLELKMKLAGSIDRSTLAPGMSYLFFVGTSENRLELFVYPKSTTYRSPGARDVVDSPAARIDGNEISLYVNEEQLALTTAKVKVWAYTGTTITADSLETTFELPATSATTETDFSATSTIEVTRPLAETFSLPTVNVYGVWDRIKTDLGFTDAEIDGVAIYTPFLSDLILSPYGAFASYSNPGADGIAPGSSKDLPKTPVLMNMNALTFSSNASRDGRQYLLLHEFGHRWLYYFDLLENGDRHRVLNPGGPHPAQWVHTPSAFGNMTSAMGGGEFTPAANGSFSYRTEFFGYSWHELYLMGLAAPEEVSPWFYLRDTDPRLGDEYHPGSGTVKGTRVDVHLQQLIDAMGPRIPASANSQKTFRILFVILERASDPITKFDASFRTDFESAFDRATGGRGKVITSVPAKAKPKRRAAGKS